MEDKKLIEEELIEKFNVFVEVYCPEDKAYLLDNDENAGEKFRESIRYAIQKAREGTIKIEDLKKIKHHLRKKIFKRGYLRALEDVEKMLQIHIIKLNDFIQDYWNNEKTDYRAMLEQILIDLEQSLKELGDKK